MDPLLVRLDREPEPGFKPRNLVIVLEARLPQFWTIPRLCTQYVRWRQHVASRYSVHGSERPHAGTHELLCLGKPPNLKSRAGRNLRLVRGVSLVCFNATSAELRNLGRQTCDRGGLKKSAQRNLHPELFAHTSDHLNAQERVAAK